MRAEPGGPVAAGSPTGAFALPPAETLAVAGRVAAAIAAAVLVGAGSGSATVAAVLVGVAVADRRAGAAAVLATLAAGIRFRTDGLGDLAGIQSVLGIAGEVGPSRAAASAWLAAAAVVLAASAARAPTRWLALVTALPVGLLAAALVAGPGPDQLGRRAVASAVAVVIAAGLALGAHALAMRSAPVRDGWDVWDDVAGDDPADAGAADPWPGWGVTTTAEPEAPGSTGAGRVVAAALPWAAVACGLAATVLAGWPS